MKYRVDMKQVLREDGSLVWQSDHKLHDVMEEGLGYNMGVASYDKETGECVIQIEIIGDDDDKVLKKWKKLGHIKSVIETKHLLVRREIDGQTVEFVVAVEEEGPMAIDEEREAVSDK